MSKEPWWALRRLRKNSSKILFELFLEMSSVNEASTHKVLHRDKATGKKPILQKMAFCLEYTACVSPLTVASKAAFPGK